MTKKTIGIIAVAIAIILGVTTYALRDELFPKATQPARPATTPSATEQADTSSSTYKQYTAMTGELYDRNFIANMIAHHQGAVDMAKLAVTSAKHPELIAMAHDIIAAQEKEMSDMTTWQQEWGYPSTSADNMMDHSAMGMMEGNGSMMAQLDGKTGDDFDKAFLEQMIMHHQSAIDMAAPGKDNASRQELKDLTVVIVDAQTKEIQQMEQWQKEWGY